MKNKQIKVGTILSYASIAFSIVASLIYMPWMISIIGQSDYGLYTLAHSLIGLFLMDFGLGAAATRYISKYLAQGEQQKANAFFSAIFKLYTFVDIVIFAVFTVVFIFADYIYVSLSPEELIKFKVVYVIAASYAVVSFPFISLNGVLTSYERFIPLKIANILYRFLTIFLTIIILLFGGKLYSLVIATSLAGAVAIIFKLVVVKTSTPLKFQIQKTDSALYKKIFSFSLWTTVAALSQRLIFNITPSILGITSNSAQIAIFGIVITIEGYTYTTSTAINGMFMPRVAKIYEGENSNERMNSLMIKVGRFMCLVNGLIIAGFVVLGKQFITLWMGKEFLSAYYCILLVVIPGFFYNPLEIAHSAMIMKKKVKLQAAIALITGIINVILSLLLSYLFGAIGAAVSIAIAFSFRAIAYHTVYHKVMHLDMSNFIRQCYLRILPPVILTLITGALTQIIPLSAGWGSFVVRGFCLVLAYMVFCLLFYANKDERALLKKFAFRKNLKEK